tara:strand:+ start:28335 stop:28466 length:132 start_codon:yes stop_codon:yes gene_type:complete
MKKAEETREAVTKKTQDAVDSANEAIDKKVNTSKDSLMKRLAQ